MCCRCESYCVDSELHVVDMKINALTVSDLCCRYEN